VWNEHQEGTCGVGTALIEQVPLTVHKGDHFRAKNANLTCSCAPIIGPSGKPMGLIDVSALHSPDSKESQHLALQLVMQSARMIESAYFFSQFEDQWVLRLSLQRELAEVSSECLIALDGEGRILSADRIANCVLAKEISGGGLAGRMIGEIFDVNLLDASSIEMLIKEVKKRFGRLDILINNIEVEDFEAIIFVGGMGSSEYWDDPVAREIVKKAVSLDKLICAICIAPVTLANAGILDGKKATVFRSEVKAIKKKGAIYTGKAVEVDGNIITAEGPQAATEFGQTIINLLLKKIED